mgnify:CR=1 FL=1|tara:strand:- start:74 stop:562 length:489 start_codon:yes stop_codon:yes gene_type:complete
MKNIDNEEQQILVKQKLKEGMGIKLAVEEVQRDVEYVKDLNEEIKESKRELKRQKKELIKVNKDFKKAFDKLTKQKEQKEVREKPTKKSYTINANTKHLSRIIYYLEESPMSIVTRIAKDNCMTTNMTNDGLRFLIKMNIVEEINDGRGVKSYILKIGKWAK